MSTWKNEAINNIVKVLILLKLTYTRHQQTKPGDHIQPMEVLKKAKSRTIILANNSTACCMSKEIEDTNLTRYMHPMFTAAFFTIANIWKQTKYPSTDEWIKKMWYVYTIDYYSAINKDLILPLATAWIGLEHLYLLK